ncbi:DUF4138 domain-containing protein [Bacteroides clarus]|uniref:DUF4138 domain-containing protein n=1 Tax=Bacteroides clarus TaxID=626929 RepID=A0A412N724_9BACE|nr:DUF4138 domain-containing protein [Bacteroides clarus]
MPFDMSFIRINIIDRKVLKRTTTQENSTSCNLKLQQSDRDCRESTVRTVYVLPKFTISDRLKTFFPLAGAVNFRRV